MTQVLYRKYRPKIFAEVSGQDTIRRILQNEIASGRIAHAYLFSGSRGIGKTSVARILARAINCLNRGAHESEPCNQCISCLTISAGGCFDVLEIDAASHTGVDNVRDNIIEGSRFPPSQTKYKVFIIDEVHMLSRGAFNALLKTLEEAPAQVVFILATTELHKVPETVASRCEHFAFLKITTKAITSKLHDLATKEEVQLDEEATQAIVGAARGSLRDALGLLGQLISSTLNDGQITLAEVELVIPKSNKSAVARFYELLREKNTGELLKLMSDLTEEGIDAEKFYDDCINFGRELILEDPTNNIELVKFLENLLEKKNLIRFSPLPQIPLELVLIDFCQSHRSTENLVPHYTSTSSVGAEQARTNPEIKMQNEILFGERSPVESPSSSTGRSRSIDITLDQIKERWNEFLEKINLENHSLPLILRLAEPLEIKGGALKIAVQYRFHRERLNELKTRQVVEKLLQEIFDAPLRIEALVCEESKENQPSILNTVLQEFGGRVVE